MRLASSRRAAAASPLSVSSAQVNRGTQRATAARLVPLCAATHTPTTTTLCSSVPLPPLSSPFERVASLAIRSLGLDRPHVAACEQCQTSKAVVGRAFGVVGSPSHTSTPARAANAKPVKPVRCLPCRSLNESTMPLSCSGTLPHAMPFRRMPKEAVQP